MIQSALATIVLSLSAATAHATQSAVVPTHAPAPDTGQSAVAVHNLGIAGRLSFVFGWDIEPGRVFVADESAHGGQDLNGDGDTTDLVAHTLSNSGTSATNLGLAIGLTAPVAIWGSKLVQAGSMMVMVVSEADHGGTDLNADGDALDFVVHVHDTTSGTTTNLGLAVGKILRTAPGSMLFDVHEGDQGQTDLNGDGDVSDAVLHHVDLASGVVSDLGLALGEYWGFSGGPELWSFYVGEFSQGVDLDGDGQIAGHVAHLYEPATGTITNLGPSARGSYGATGGRALLGRDEARLGVDLNLDGDLDDTLLEIYEPSTGKNLRTGLAFTAPGTSVGFLLDRGYLAGRFIFLPVEESDQDVDLNGDGDKLDDVLHRVSLVEESVLNLGLAATNTFPYGVELAGGKVHFAVSEAAQGGTDLNVDLDATDEVLHVHDLATGLTTSTQRAGRLPCFAGPGLLGFAVVEASQDGHVLDGDGDATDEVFHVSGPGANEVRNLQVAAMQQLLVEPGLWPAGPSALAIGVDEADSGGIDLNGDGDSLDVVLHRFEATAGGLTNLGLAIGWTLPFEGGVMFEVSEAENGNTDLNGDGDTNDVVLHVLPNP